MFPLSALLLNHFLNHNSRKMEVHFTYFFSGMPEDDDSDHDYEEVRESVRGTICKMGTASLRN